MDVLPSDVQRALHLFVYKGCACGAEAWVKIKVEAEISFLGRRMDYFYDSIVCIV